MKRLVRLYIGVVAVLLVTMAAGLVYQVRVTARYAASRDASEQFLDRQEGHEALLHAATDAVAAGNSALDLDPAKKAQAAAAAEQTFLAFQRTFEDERRRIVTSEARSVAPAILKELNDVQAPMAGLIYQARLVFRSLEEGKPKEVALRVAYMNRDYVRVRAELADVDALNDRLRKDELRLRAEETERQRRIYASLIVALIVASFVVIAFYGRRMMREVVSVEELGKREAQLRKLHLAFEHVLAGIAFVGPDGRFVEVNRALAETIGYEPEEMIGMLAAELICGSDKTASEGSSAELRAKGKSECELRIARKNGEPMEIRLMRVVSTDTAGNVLGHYSFVRDISEQKRAEALLRRSEERFHLATKATSNIVFEWDFETNACWCNEAMEQEFGFDTSGDVDLTLWSDAIHPDDRERAFGGIQAAIAEGRDRWTDEYRFRRGDGVYIEVISHGYIVRDDAGKPLRMVGATIDLSERKRAERAFNTQILNAAADGIFGLDTEGRATFVNQSTARLLGWSVEELLGKRMHDVAHRHPEDSKAQAWEECLAAGAALRSGVPSASDREVYWRKDGSSFTVEYAASPIRDVTGKVTGAVVTFRDISERRAVERMKDEFVSVVSHELRTPLTSIRGALGLMQGGRLGEMPEKAKRMIDIAVSNTDRLVRLINDILDIERMQSGTITLARSMCSVEQLTSRAIDLMKPAAEKGDVELCSASCGGMVYGDADRLLQTLSNLLSNAIKFSPPGTSVTLTSAVQDGDVLFQVEDHGRGIPADKLELIFERFQQVDASDSREKGGTGLGLAICRTIVRQHGGRIWAESATDNGSRFLFTVPRTPPAEALVSHEATTAAVCVNGGSGHAKLAPLLEENDDRESVVQSGKELIERSSSGSPDNLIARPGAQSHAA